MLTADHNVACKTQGATESPEFRRELIRRFFNPKSYFFLCLSTQLENASSIATDLSEEDYLLIGQVMDVLVNEENPLGKLEQLSVIERFRDFCENLEDGVRQLRESEPSTEEMKHTIEGMAHTLVDALIDVLHAPASRARLAEIIHEQPSGDVAAAIDINESIVEKHMSFVDGEAAAPSGETPVGPHTEQKPSAKDEEAGEKAAAESGLVVEALTVGKGREPQALQEYALRQVGAMIAAVERTLRSINSKPGNRQKWTSLCRQLQGLRDTAMIHGLEDIESFAFKGWRLLEVRARLNPFPQSGAWYRLYQQLAEAMRLTTDRDADHESSLRLSRLTDTFKVLIAHPEKIDELVTLPSSSPVKYDQSAAAAPSAAADLAKLELPGEDDEELIELITQVRHEREEQFEVPAMGQFGETTNERPGSRQKPGSSKKSRAPLAHFHEESELYFEIAEEAVQNLFVNGSSRLAVESLELGAYSLKVAARKLGLEPLARFPEHVEELAKKTMALGVPFTDAALRAISDGLGMLKQVERLEDLETPAMRQLTNQILKFTKCVEDGAATATVAQRTSGAKSGETAVALNELQEGIREKETKGKQANVAAPSSTAQPRARDTIDFLMADESDMEPE